MKFSIALAATLLGLVLVVSIIIIILKEHLTQINHFFQNNIGLSTAQWRHDEGPDNRYYSAGSYRSDEGNGTERSAGAYRYAGRYSSNEENRTATDYQYDRYYSSNRGNRSDASGYRSAAVNDYQ